MSDAEVLTRRVIPGTPTKIDEALFFAACERKGCTSEEDRVRLLGMPRRSVLRYVKSEFEPRLHTARWIARQLDVKVDELWPAA
jgi:hypothetical protein